jgi:hypothetical protein
MAVDLKLKRSHTHSTIPSTSDLVEGEFAVNTYDGKMYMRDGSNNVVTVGNHYATDYESSTKTFYVTVATSTASHVHHGSGSSNKYKINGVFSPFLKLIPGITYRFDQSDSSNSGHPFRFYLDENKGTAYTTGVSYGSGSAGSANAYTEIVVTHSTPSILHYQCSAHGLMGWAAFVNTSNLTAFDTGDLTEGSNLYFTNARADARIAAATTDDLSEGSSNLYHTTARVNSAIDSRVTNTFINNLSGVVADTATILATSRNIHGVAFNGSADIDLSEVIQDTVGAMFSGNTETNITATYQDSDGTIDLVVSASGIASLADDSSPQLGGDLDVNGNSIVSASNGNIAITPNGSGKVIIDGLSHPVADGNAGQVLKTDGSGNLAFASVGSLAGSGIQNVSDDSSPQLGGNLDLVTHSIVTTSNRNITLAPNGSGKVVVSSTGIEFSDGSVQTAAGADQGFAIAMGIALG